MPSDKTTNYEFDLINDSDSVKAGVKTKPNANWNALDELLHDNFATKESLAEVATSGNYEDLINKPTIPTLPSYMSQQDASDLVDDVLTWHTIRFSKNSPDATGTQEDMIIPDGTTFTLPNCTFIRSGYEFSNWSWQPDGSAPDSGGQYTATQSASVYAQWVESV